MMMIEDQAMVLVRKSSEIDEAGVAEAAGEQPASSQQTVVASFGSSSNWSPSTGSLVSLLSPDHQSGATLPAATAEVAPDTIRTNNPSISNTNRPQAEQVTDGLSLTLSAEEEDSQLKSSIYSNDDDTNVDDDDDDDDDGDDDDVDTEDQANLSSCSPNGVEPISLTQQQPPADYNSDSLLVKDSSCPKSSDQTIELRLLVRRREAGALIGKRGTNIKRLREKFRSSMFSIPDTGNGPERVVCVATNEKCMQPILDDLSQLLVEKSPENNEQIELKLLIHSSQAGSIIGMGGQSIKKLRNDSKAAIKIYELCCPLSNERVCAIKARPPVVVNTIKLIQSILNENPIKGTIKPYDALHFDLMLAEKYGGFLPDDGLEAINQHPYPQHQHQLQIQLHHHHRSRGGPMMAYARQYSHATSFAAKHYPLWRSPIDPYDEHQRLLEMNEGIAHHLEQHHQSIGQAQLQQPQNQLDASSSTSPSSSPHLQPPNKQCNHFYRNLCRQQKIKQNPPMMDCNKLKFTKLCPPGTNFVPAAAPLASELTFRYHPYAPQGPGPIPLYPPACVRPTLRHHHHHNYHHHPMIGDQVYAPGAVLYGPIHNNRKIFTRMQAIFDGPQQLSTSDRCHHTRPCSCILVQAEETLQAAARSNQPSGQQTNAPASQFAPHLATTKFVRHLRSPAASNGYNNNINNNNDVNNSNSIEKP